MENFFLEGNAIAPNAPNQLCHWYPQLVEEKQKLVKTTVHKCSKDGCSERGL